MTESRYTIRPLDVSTRDTFAALVGASNGIFGGCWCIGFHPPDDSHADSTEPNRLRRLDHRTCVATAALTGALGQIAGLGGGRVEGCPEPATATKRLPLPRSSFDIRACRIHQGSQDRQASLGGLQGCRAFEQAVTARCSKGVSAVPAPVREVIERTPVEVAPECSVMRLGRVHE